MQDFRSAEEASLFPCDQMGVGRAGRRRPYLNGETISFSHPRFFFRLSFPFPFIRFSLSITSSFVSLLRPSSPSIPFLFFLQRQNHLRGSSDLGVVTVLFLSP